MRPITGGEVTSATPQRDDEAVSKLTRRRALGLGAKALAGVLVSTTAGCGLFGGDGADDRGYLDVSDPDVVRTVRPLRLTLADAPLLGRRTGSQTLLFLGSSRDENPIQVTVSTVQRRTALGRTRPERGGHRVDLEVSATSPQGVWVRANGYGEPQQPGDRLLVQTKYGDLFVEVWIEPTAGQWRAPSGPGGTVDLGIVGVHAALMRRSADAEVLYFSPPRNRDSNQAFLRDPGRPGEWQWNAGGMEDLEVRVCDLSNFSTTERPMEAAGTTPRWNLFCSGHAHLADGRLLIAGGHIASVNQNAKFIHIYDPSAGAAAWTRVPGVEMNQTRWYPTVTTLPDGRMLITSGSGQSATGLGIPGIPYIDDNLFSGFWTHVHNNYEIFDPATMRMVDVQFGDHTLIDENAVNDLGRDVSFSRERVGTYPAVFVLPGPRDGTKVALVETNRGWLFDYVPSATNRLPLQGRGGPFMMATKGSRSYPHYGSVVLLPYDASTTRFRILAVGGQGERNGNHRDTSNQAPATATAEILDVDTQRANGDQRWRRGPSLARRRLMCDATLLADGLVLVSGGADHGWTNRNQGPVLDAELFDPESESFRPAARATIERRYHSTALLLPDATVLKAGSHGGFDADTTWIVSHLDAELYYPGYLWRAPRPTILEVRAGGGQAIGYDRTVEVVARGQNLTSPSRVALARCGSVTHGNDMDQRYIRLEGRMRRSGEQATFRVRTPTNPGSAPPGDYMLFVLDGLGVPSKATIVRLGPGGTGQPEEQPQDEQDSTTSSESTTSSQPDAAPPPPTTKPTEPTVDTTPSTQPGTPPLISFTVLPTETKQQCVDGLAPPFELLLDNTASNVAVKWSAVIEDVVPGTKDPWATASPAAGEVGAGQISKMVVAPLESVCPAIASSKDGGETKVTDLVTP
jgi:hypothetical protein